MEIRELRVVENKLDTPEGEMVGPDAYFMDVAITEEHVEPIPIAQSTYVQIHNLMARTSPAMTRYVAEYGKPKTA